MNSTAQHVPASAMASHVVTAGPDRRAAAWLSARLVRGRKERFCEVVKVTPAMAAAILERNSYNRPLSAASVRRYAELMMRGMWRLTTEGIALSADGVLINGQHRLAALREAGHSVDMTVWFGCAANEFEVADQGVKRTAGQVLQIKGFAYANVAAAVAAVLGRFGRFAENRDHKGLATQAVIALAEDLDRQALEEACRHGVQLIRVTAATGPALAYWHISQTSINAARLPEFWEGLGSGEGLFGVKLQLREWLDKGPYTRRNGEHVTVKRAAAIVLAWNAWLKKSKRSTSLEWNKVTSLPVAS